MIRICFAGLTGWTAPPILAAIDEADDLTLVAGVSRASAGRSLTEVTGLGFDGTVFASLTEALHATTVDVVIDYTSAAVVRDNATAAVAAGVNLVIGTSGLTAEDYSQLDRAAREQGVGIVAAGNFSILAAVLARSAAIAAQHAQGWEIIDYASAEKPDVPSGTSRELAERLAEIREPAATVPLDQLHGPAEARGAEIAKTRIHSVRLPGYVVTTEITFANPGERLSIRHDPGLSPEPYVAGTLLAVRAVSQHIGLTRGLDTLLF